ncbi:hypothetical protein OUZ56_012951 [Daphnia magna]|uniref:Uncharacterized protein n=1 Tax=Daphnia magna TaxID=35525 RepID=A0ABQ9Z4J1_9CRUS|nr:hypothetical protein OUZ56_012951 [Daphnia magna]
MRPDFDKHVFINFNKVKQEYRGIFNNMSTTRVTTLRFAFNYEGSIRADLTNPMRDQNSDFVQIWVKFYIMPI